MHQYSGDDAPKRRRLAHACETCRARKVPAKHTLLVEYALTSFQKRCVHFSGAETTNGENHQQPKPAEAPIEAAIETSTRSKTRASSASRPTPSSQARTNGSSGIDANRSHRPNSSSSTARARFLSDLNPESALFNRPVPGAQKLPNDDIGVWVDRREWDALIKQRKDANHLDGMSQAIKQDQRPHATAIEPLINIYFKKIHPILPLLDADEFRRTHAEGLAPEPLVHAICLVAGKDKEAEQHLKLSESTTTVSPRHFCSVLHDSVTAAVRVPLRYERVALIRILALTSMHIEGPEGAEEASILLSRAMQYSQTLGIHLGQQAASAAGNELLMKRLFWCLWVLDRLNAATNGRPIIMSDVDIAIEPFAPGESGFPAFEAWLNISHVLNRVIDFYRPTKDTSLTGWEGDFLALEEIIDEVDGWYLPASVLGTIHLYFLCVGILSHRTRGVREIACSKHSHIRQRLFAIEIVRLMNAPKSPTLHPLPILPYAISLALSVSYQHLRQSQLEHQQADARQDFRICCKILQNLRRTWCSADVIATLAKRVLDEIDRAPDLASFRIRRIRRPGQGKELAQNPENDIIPPPTACKHGVAVTQQLTPGYQAVAGHGMHQQEGLFDAAGPLADQNQQNGFNLLDNMDDVFGTFMDPNYPLNLDDMSFVDDLTPFDWNAEIDVGSS